MPVLLALLMLHWREGLTVGDDYLQTMARVTVCCTPESTSLSEARIVTTVEPSAASSATVCTRHES